MMRAWLSTATSLENDRAADDGGGIDLGSGAMMLHVPAWVDSSASVMSRNPASVPRSKDGRLEEEVPRGNARGGERGPQLAARHVIGSY
jgi:hypothetical protein